MDKVRKNEGWDPDAHYPESQLHLEDKKIEPKAQKFFKDITRDWRLANISEQALAPLLKEMTDAFDYGNFGFRRMQAKCQHEAFLRVVASGGVDGHVMQELHTQRQELFSQEDKQLKALGKGALNQFNKGRGYFRR